VENAVSSKVKESEVEMIKRKVDKMYENYGIAVDGMGDGDLTTVYRYYFDNKDELDEDYEKSKKSVGKFDEDDII
jgi:hypothetical protein